jgi:hypothetical protein
MEALSGANQKDTLLRGAQGRKRDNQVPDSPVVIDRALPANSLTTQLTEPCEAAAKVADVRTAPVAGEAAPGGRLTAIADADRGPVRGRLTAIGDADRGPVGAIDVARDCLAHLQVSLDLVGAQVHRLSEGGKRLECVFQLNYPRF